MMIAAQAMMAISGEFVAASTPSGEVHAPATPAIRPIFAMHVLFFRCVMQPAIEVGTIVKSEVAVETMAESPNPKRKSGIMSVPPPIPKRPEKIPTISPATIEKANCSITLGAYSPSARLRWISPVLPASKLGLGIETSISPPASRTSAASISAC